MRNIHSPQTAAIKYLPLGLSSRTTCRTAKTPLLKKINQGRLTRIITGTRWHSLSSTQLHREGPRDLANASVMQRPHLASHCLPSYEPAALPGSPLCPTLFFTAPPFLHSFKASQLFRSELRRETTNCSEVAAIVSQTPRGRKQLWAPPPTKPQKIFPLQTMACFCECVTPQKKRYKLTEARGMYMCGYTCGLQTCTQLSNTHTKIATHSHQTKATVHY